MCFINMDLPRGKSFFKPKKYPMKTDQSKPKQKSIVNQAINNTTSWIGHRQGETGDRITGQTFTCPAAGQLDCIEIFSAYVNKKIPVDLTLYSFDTEHKTWGPAIATSTIEFCSTDAGKWVAFPLNGLHLKKDMTYGFKLKTETGLVGVGEAAGCLSQLPYAGGQQWTANAEGLPGKYFSYLSLAFKVALRA